MLVFSLISITPGQAHAHSVSPQMKTKHGEVEQLVREVTASTSAQEASLLNSSVCFLALRPKWSPNGPNLAGFGQAQPVGRPVLPQVSLGSDLSCRPLCIVSAQLAPPPLHCDGI